MRGKYNIRPPHLGALGGIVFVVLYFLFPQILDIFLCYNRMSSLSHKNASSSFIYKYLVVIKIPRRHLFKDSSDCPQREASCCSYNLIDCVLYIEQCYRSRSLFFCFFYKECVTSLAAGKLNNLLLELKQRKKITKLSLVPSSD